MRSAMEPHVECELLTILEACWPILETPPCAAPPELTALAKRRAYREPARLVFDAAAPTLDELAKLKQKTLTDFFKSA